MLNNCGCNAKILYTKNCDDFYTKLVYMYFSFKNSRRDHLLLKRFEGIFRCYSGIL